MKSYLSTLAARALEQPPPIRPRLASLFEPPAGPHINFRETAFNTRRATKPQRGASPTVIGAEVPSKTAARERTEDRPAIAPATSESEPRRARLKSYSESITPVAVPAREQNDSPELFTGNPAIPEAIEIKAQPDDGHLDTSAVNGQLRPPAELPVQIDQAITLEQTTVIENVAAPLTPAVPVIERLSAEAQPTTAVIVKPEVSADRTETQWGIEPHLAESDLPPAVRITIGRVDVRAVMPAPAAANAKQPSVKTLSLDEYLKQRSGGHR